MALALPVGRRGRALAVGLAVCVLALAWFAAVQPVLDAYAVGAERLTERRALARRMRELAQSLPRLQAEVASANTARPDVGEVFQGSSDAIDGAALASMIGAMAKGVGAHIESTEALPGESVRDEYRRIGVRVTVNAPWPTAVKLLRAVAMARPRLFADDIRLQAPLMLGGNRQSEINGTFTVYALRANSGNERPPATDRVAGWSVTR